MSNKLVLIDGNKAFTTSRVLASGCLTEHNAVLKLTKKYTDDLNDIGGTSSLEIQKFKTAGRPGEEVILNEAQATFLISLMKNSKPVVAFKKNLTKEFFKMRSALANIVAQRKDPNWMEMRKDGKISHKEKTDVIKRFVEYSTKQGSKSANRYYMALAKMENSALFFLEQRFKNVREVLLIRQLMIVSMADDVIEKALEDGMADGLEYKECFKLAKERVIAFAQIAGRSPILSLELKGEG
jgi:phage regulator Rha-like protein